MVVFLSIYAATGTGSYGHSRQVMIGCILIEPCKQNVVNSPYLHLLLVQYQNSLLVIHQIDNFSPGAVTGRKTSPYSHIIDKLTL